MERAALQRLCLFGAIIEIGTEKDAGKIGRCPPPGADREKIFVEIHKEDMAGRESPTVFFHQTPIEHQNAFRLTAGFLRRSLCGRLGGGAESVEGAFVGIVERDPSDGLARVRFQSLRIRIGAA